MSLDFGNRDSFTLGIVKEMGHRPIAITEHEGEEVFIFETDEEAKAAEHDFYPEGIWITKEGLASYSIKSKIIDLIGKPTVATGDGKPELVNSMVISFRGALTTDERVQAVVAERLKQIGVQVNSRMSSAVTHAVYLDEAEIKADGDNVTKYQKKGIVIQTFKELTEWYLQIHSTHAETNPVKGKTIVFSGFRNGSFEAFIESFGGSVSASVTKSTDILVVRKMGSGTAKETKAVEYGVTIMTDREFQVLIKESLKGAKLSE